MLMTNTYVHKLVFLINNLQDVGWMVFYFRKDVKSSSEYYIYSIPVMLAEIGGYMGLLLGISLFDMSLGIDYILDSLDMRNRKIASNEEIKTVRPMDDQWMANDRTIQRPFGLRKILQGNYMKDLTFLVGITFIFFAGGSQK